MIELLKECLDRLRLAPVPDIDAGSGCGFTDEEIENAPVVELEPE